ncbi:hypothetical protein P775_05630 [Puniceibacterium antarcticum]|uniref:PRC-barrel domain-containing protein n=1 Tax=Puniceibacterium antarcticum TaxID=1206336 RepID=A0A2G8RI76_9RHOB|nr:PRC-barrel domain-containing protein [Puniceibacterium antarcticum]PIL21193.1 hypothetical protein P775_05630 [Puniceibacterium antarcticum]
MTKFTTATAIALTLVGTSALAQDQNSGDTMSSEMTSVQLANMQGDLIRTRDITGGTIYTTNEADDESWDATAQYDAVGANWNEIGEIEDVILSRDGKMIGIVGEVGGFLDVGDKHVAIAVNDVSLVAVDDQEYAYVTRLNEEDLEELPGVDEGFWN